MRPALGILLALLGSVLLQWGNATPAGSALPAPI